MPIELRDIPALEPVPQGVESAFEGSRADNPNDSSLGGGGEEFVYKPHAFALTHGDGGAKITYGELHYGVTIQEVTRVALASGETVVESITQSPIQETKVCVPKWKTVVMNPEIPNKSTQLDAYGEIYLYWEYSIGNGGSVTTCEIRVGRPVEQDISFLNEDLERGDGGELGFGCVGKFALHIGTVNVGSPVIQKVTSDVPWFAHVIQDTSPCVIGSSSSDSSSSSAATSTSTPTSSTSKSTCIVPVPQWFHCTGYAALFIMESPEVRFEDFTQVEITGEITKLPVDPKYVVVCEPGTLNVRSVQGRRPVAYGAWVGHDGYLYVDSGLNWEERRGIVNISITGIRRGFAKSSNPGDSFYDPRFPARTADNFFDNEAYLNQAYSHQEPCP